MKETQNADISQIDTMTAQFVVDVKAMLNAKDIHPNEVQQKMLETHLKAMVMRSITGEPLPEVDKSLFDEISPESMQMAEEVVNLFSNLPIEEAWLLSVHFEVARDNNQ